MGSTLGWTDHSKMLCLRQRATICSPVREVSTAVAMGTSLDKSLARDPTLHPRSETARDDIVDRRVEAMFNLRFALRTLFSTPLVTSIAIVSLALGLGANSAIFSMFDQML